MSETAPDALAVAERTHRLLWGDEHGDEVCEGCSIIAVALTEYRNEGIEEAAGRVPLTWLDPLLTGDGRVIDSPPYGCPDVERLLRAVRDRIRSLKRTP